MRAGEHIRVVDLRKRYGRTGPWALRSVGFTIPRGEVFGLMGPSGCGKSTTLGIIAGFVTPDAGQVLVDGRDILPVPPHKRGLPMVFQDYALFPHLRVHDNVGFALKLRGTPASTVASRVGEMLRMVGLEHKSDRLPEQLSGGEQQRVALARALAIGPEVVLLDEPLSNLDAKLRQQLRRDIRDVLQRTGVTAVFVTHDQAEAFAVCDRVGVMFDGTIAQMAPPPELYRRPASMDVARFVGESNVFPAVVVEGGAAPVVDIEVAGHGTVRLPVAAADAPAVGQRGSVLVRPESVGLADAPADGTALPGRVERAEFLGPVLQATVAVGDRTLLVTLSSWGDRAVRGDQTWLSLGDAFFVPEAPAGAHPGQERERVPLDAGGAA
ncbi:ABC transporter ATP-binding protein [Phytohabitans kaempferiae]|uniref:ABC transporter ATP-binding protein n=1 Tax=Phytohabitans kaempferiae TaxID=1620943 RepID=A0ABV6M7T5_9ACTN